MYRSLTTFLSQNRPSLHARSSSFCLLASILLRITWECGGAFSSLFVGPFACVQSPHTNQTATGLITTPLPTPIFAPVYKEPATASLGRRAFLHPFHKSRGQHALNRTRERPLKPGQPTLRWFPLPGEMRRCWNETLVDSGLHKQSLQHMHIGGDWRGLVDQG